MEVKNKGRQKLSETRGNCVTSKWAGGSQTGSWIQKEVSREKLVKSEEKSGVRVIVIYKVSLLVFDKGILAMQDFIRGGTLGHRGPL